MSGSSRVALGSLALSVVVLAIKGTAFLMTDSVALYSDALESVINVATAVVAIVAIRIAAKPADAGHPYGHHKAEYLSSVLVGVLIVVAALAILREAYLGFVSPAPIARAWAGLAVSSVATVLNLLWSLNLVRRGRLLRSASLVADGKHLMADVVTSAGVLVGVVLVVVTGIEALDAAVAALVALQVLWSGWGVVRESTSGLLDEAVPEDELSAIRAVISSTAGEAIEAHALRTRHSGKATFIDFHLVVPGGMSVSAAHGICDRVEAALRDRVEGAVTTIHLEPDHEAEHRGIVVL